MSSYFHIWKWSKNKFRTRKVFQLPKRFEYSSNQYVWNISIGRQFEFSSLSLSEWKWRPVSLRHFTIPHAEKEIFSLPHYQIRILNFTFANLPSNWNNFIFYCPWILVLLRLQKCKFSFLDRSKMIDVSDKHYRSYDPTCISNT